MCYPCTMCNGCGKFDPDSPLFIPQAAVHCLDCGGEVDAATGLCVGCGKQVMVPPGMSSADEAAIKLGMEAESVLDTVA